MKVRIVGGGLSAYTGLLGSVEFADGVSTRELHASEIRRLASCFEIAELESGKQLDPNGEYERALYSAEVENDTVNHPTAEEFAQMQLNARNELTEAAIERNDNYGSILSEDNEVMSNSDLVADPEIAGKSAEGTNDFIGEDDDDEGDDSDLVAAEQAAGVSISGVDESEPTVSEVIDVPQSEVEIKEAHIYTREELEDVADNDGIAGLRDIADPLNVHSKSISALIEGILKAQGV